MDLTLHRDWKQLFALAAEAKAAKRREEQTRQFYADLDRRQEKKHKAKEKDEKETRELLEAATTAQLAVFTQRLDNYDTQTVHALMENGEALDRLRLQLRQLEENAYVLPDGRRVYKTQDGQRVFDEQGVALGRDVIDPRMIEDHHTTWEALKAAHESEAKLQAERQGLLDYQAKLDEARNHSSHGTMTKQQLDDLDADLQANAPPAVRQKLGLAPEAGTGMKLEAEGSTPSSRSAVIDERSRRSQAALARS